MGVSSKAQMPVIPAGMADICNAADPFERPFDEGPRTFRTSPGTIYDRWPLMSLVISNIETWGFWKISFSLASALMLRLLAVSCSLWVLM